MNQYKSFSHTYDLLDTLFFKRNSPRAALIEMIPDGPIKVLDGCAGTGTCSLLIAQNRHEARVVALDKSDHMLRVADRKFKEAQADNAETVLADATGTGFAVKSFDIILLSLTLHEMTETARASVLTEAKRLLTDSGKIIVVEWQQPKKYFQRLKFSLIKLLEPKGFKAFLHSDLSAYFKELGLFNLEKRCCAYTQVIALSRQRNEV